MRPENPLHYYMKYTIAIGVLALGCSTSLFAAAPAATNAAASAPKAATATTNAAAAAAPGDIVAKGKGLEITREQLNKSMESMLGAMAGQQIPPERLQGVRPQILERLIGMELIKSKATDADKAKAKEIIDERMAEIRKSAGSDEAIEKQLKTRGMTLEDFKAKMMEEGIVQAVLERELKVQVSDDEVKKYYEDNPSKFEQPETVRAAHILIMTQDPTGQPLSEEKKKERRKVIDDLLKKARDGEDFAKLAKEYSEDPGSKDKGGEYTFPKGQMVPEFEAAAWALKTNEISDVVTTQYGYHIIKLYEKNPAKKMTLAEVAPRLKEALKGQKLQPLVGEYVDKLKEEANVQILDESLKPTPPPIMDPSLVSPPASASTNSAGKKK